MYRCTPLFVLIVFIAVLVLHCTFEERPHYPLIFASFAEDEHQLDNVLLMAESIRTFAGTHKNAPVWVYAPPGLVVDGGEIAEQCKRLAVEVKTCEAPVEALWFYFARKVFAAGAAEAEAEKLTAILAWLDEDTIVLREPREFMLPQGKVLGYRPVMHRNIGSVYAEPADAFWSRALEKMSVDPSSLFPMATVADGDTLRPYFNAGCLVLRPQRGVLRRWGEYFSLLYQDSLLTSMCREDVRKRIFIHQVALTGAILNHLDRGELLQLSERVNYPIFFREMFGARREFHDINEVVTFRHESYFSNPQPDWKQRLSGPADRIAWIEEHLIKK